MEAGAIPNGLQDPPVAIACSQAFAQGFLHAGGECRQSMPEHDEPGQPGAFRITVTVRVISASAVSSGAQRAQRQEPPKDGRRR
jgi:hypothetical protein